MCTSSRQLLFELALEPLDGHPRGVSVERHISLFSPGTSFTVGHLHREGCAKTPSHSCRTFLSNLAASMQGHSLSSPSSCTLSIVPPPAGCWWAAGRGTSWMEAGSLLPCRRQTVVWVPTLRPLVLAIYSMYLRTNPHHCDRDSKGLVLQHGSEANP